MPIPLIASLLPALIQAAQGQQQQSQNSISQVIQNLRQGVNVPERPAQGGGYRGPMMGQRRY